MVFVFVLVVTIFHVIMEVQTRTIKLIAEYYSNIIRLEIMTLQIYRIIFAGKVRIKIFIDNFIYGIISTDDRQSW